MTMQAYLALIFAKQEESRSYLLEVATAIKSVAGNNFKYGEGTASMAAIAFLSDKDSKIIRKVFDDLWRPEQRTWLIRLDSPVMIDRAIMNWVRKNNPGTE
jgi:hypothetical protein